MRTIFAFVLLLFISCTNHQQPMSDIHPFRLKPGQDLKKEIEAYVKANKIKAGYVITCVGSLTDYNLRFANQPEGSKGSGHFEIVSLTGVIAENGMHLHMSISDSTGRTIGGHLMEGNIIYTTAEIVLGETDSHQFVREKDGTTPWEELQVKPGSKE